LRTQIQAYAELDTFRIKDWGFSKQVFLSSFDGADFSYSNGVEVNNSIKGFIVNRTNSINSQINYIEYPPIIYNINVSSKRLQSDEELTIGTSVFSNNQLSSVKVEVKINGEQTTYFDMNYKSDLNSPVIEDVDKWQITLGPFGNSKIVTIKIVAEDNSGSISSYPEEGIIILTGSQVADKIIINELMSSNTSEIMDDFNEYEDWIEIFNPNDTAVNLSGKYLTDKRDNLTKWKFSQEMIIQPKEYKIIWCDEDQVQGVSHTNFRLNSSGEFIALVADDGISIIDSVTLPALNENEVYAREALESSWSISSTPTPGESNIITGIEKVANIVNEYSLKAYPNPFNPSTKIEYEMEKSSDINLTVFDLLGRSVWSLEQKNMSKGKHSLYWNGVDNNGRELVTGIYFLNIDGNAFNKTIKLMLIR
ncbi:MAG: lamin tail domain-containing protein, partial [Melioribacteraceae bacterium]|nr:lamin tail domain-containing protein [Melioribacteraceae bacterium]